MDATALEQELREKTARLNDLERQLKHLQQLVGVGRRDSDFDLFCRRLRMAEIFSQLPPDVMPQLHFNEFYFEFWQLAGEAYRTTKFSAEEKNISRQLLEQAQREQNPIRRQYLALALIAFGELQTAQELFDKNLWSPQLQADFATFMKWQDLAYNPLPADIRAKMARNEQILSFLQAKYSALIQKHSRDVINDELCPRVPQKAYQIYFCWLQGEDNLPPLIRCCYNSLKQNAGRYKIVFIDEKNFSRYVDIAPHILEKFRAGKISRTHFSDILRINLLERHGGLWLDASVLVTEPLENHQDFWQLPFFSGKTCNEKNILNPYMLICKSNHETYIHYLHWYPFILGAAIRHNPLFFFAKELFEAYWREYDKPIDYFLIDFAIRIAYEYIPCVRRQIDTVPINNAQVWTLLSHLNEQYSTYPFDRILRGNFLNKLNWKATFDMTTPGTVFREIQRRYAPETIQK